MVGEDTAFGISGDAEPSLPWHWAALPLAGGDGCWVRAVGMGKPAPACLCQYPAHLEPQIPSPTPLQGIPMGLCCPLPSPGGGFLLASPSSRPHWRVVRTPGGGQRPQPCPRVCLPFVREQRECSPQHWCLGGGAAGPHLIASSWAGASETYRFPWRGT